MTTQTIFPGADGQLPGGSLPIRTFPEKLEKDIGNIIGSFCREISFCDGMTADELEDKEALLLELLDYITQNYEIKKPTGSSN
jgi:hypothetical protein